MYNFPAAGKVSFDVRCFLSVFLYDIALVPNYVLLHEVIKGTYYLQSALPTVLIDPQFDPENFSSA